MGNNNFELIKSIFNTRQDLEVLNKNFETAEEEMIDYYVYQIKANKSKLDYLTKKAKAQGIMLDMISGIKIRNDMSEAI